MQRRRRVTLASLYGVQVRMAQRSSSHCHTSHVTRHTSHVTRHTSSSATCPGVTTTLFSSPFAAQVQSNIRDFTADLSASEAEVPLLHALNCHHWHALNCHHWHALMCLQVLAGLLADVFPRNRDEGRASWEGRF